MRTHWTLGTLALLAAIAVAPACSSGSGGTDTSSDVPGDTNPFDPGTDTPGDPGDRDVPDGADDDAADAADAPDPEDAPDPADASDVAEDPGPSDLPDVVPTDAGPDAPIEGLAVDRLGARVQAPIIALSRLGRHLWFGGAYYSDPDTGAYRSQMGWLDLDTGRARVFEEELPEFVYVVDPEGNPVETGPIPTSNAVEASDGRILVNAMTGILEIVDGQFTLHAIDLPPDSPPVSPLHIAMDAGRGRLWAATNLGLLLLDPATFAVQKRYGAHELGFDLARTLAVDPATGAVFVSVFSAEAPEGKVARVLDDDVSFLVPGQGGVPQGLPGEIVFGGGKAYVALGAWDALEGGVVSWDGTTATVLARESQLGEAATGKPAAFGAQALALVEDEGILVIGGQIGSFNSFLRGGGLAWMRLSDGYLAGLSTGRDLLPGDHYSAMTWDPQTKRLYASVRQPCSEVSLGNLGLVALSFRPDGSVRVERPMLAGLRTLAVDRDRVWGGMRTDTPGLACFGVAYQGGFLELKGRGTAEMVPLLASNQPILPYSAPVRLAGRDGKWAMATRKDGFLLGPPSDLWFANQAVDWRVSLYMTDVAWPADDTIWITGPASHHGNDEPRWKDMGPKGAARLTLDASGAVISAQRFVSVAENDKDITGLPTSEIAAVVPAAEGTWMLCSAERVRDTGGDREEGPLFLDEGQPRLGGIARVNPDDSITVVAGSDVAPDPRAGALDAEGRLIVADVEKGLIRIGTGGPESLPTPAGVPEGSRPVTVWAGAGDDLVVGYTTGAAVHLGSASGFLTGIGWVWQVVPRADGVWLLATDEGLVTLSVPGVTPPAYALPEDGALPEFRQIDMPPVGECLKAGADCKATPDACCPGLSCKPTGFLSQCG